MRVALAVLATLAGSGSSTVANQIPVEFPVFDQCFGFSYIEAPDDCAASGGADQFRCWYADAFVELKPAPHGGVELSVRSHGDGFLRPRRRGAVQESIRAPQTLDATREIGRLLGVVVPERKPNQICVVLSVDQTLLLGDVFTLHHALSSYELRKIELQQEEALP